MVIHKVKIHYCSNTLSIVFIYMHNLEFEKMHFIMFCHKFWLFRLEYIHLYVDYVLNKSVKVQFDAFSEGFHNVCGGVVLVSDVHIFSVDENGALFLFSNP